MDVILDGAFRVTLPAGQTFGELGASRARFSVGASGAPGSITAARLQLPLGRSLHAAYAMQERAPRAH